MTSRHSDRAQRACRWGVLVALLVAPLVALAPQAALAADYTVCASGCSFTSIQAAIDDGGTVAGDTITVTGAEHTELGITVSKDLTIQGQGATSTIVQADASHNTASDRVFWVNSGVTATIKDMTIRHGRVVNGSTNVGGGGIYSAGTLTLQRVVIDKNRIYGTNGLAPDGNAGRGRGGGLFNGGTMIVEDSTISNNWAQGGTGVGSGDGGRGEGGGIYSGGSLTISGLSLIHI